MIADRRPAPARAGRSARRRIRTSRRATRSRSVREVPTSASVGGGTSHSESRSREWTCHRAIPNIVPSIHSHDTGRYVQPYGHPVPTPNIQRLADQGLLFRQAFCGARRRARGSRAVLLTGQWAHVNGMMGLAHRGFRAARLRPAPRPHAARGGLLVRRWWGSSTSPPTPSELGYDAVGDVDTSARGAASRPADAWSCCATARAAAVLPLRRLLRDPPRVLRVLLGARRAVLARRRANLPDTPVMRRDMASFKPSARSLDQGVGAVLNALDEHELADDTIVDPHDGPRAAVPGRARRRCSDRGIGVLLIVRGPGGFHGGRVTDALVSQIDLFPTLCELVGDRAARRTCRARSLMPVVRREVREVNEEVFAELTYHAAYDPQRAIRTRRHKYVRLLRRPRPARAAEHRRRPDARTCCCRTGYGRRRGRARSSTTCCSTRTRRTTWSRSPDHADVLADLRERLDAWMAATDDPLLRGPVPAPDGAEVNDPAGVVRPARGAGHATRGAAARSRASVQRGGELAARLARQRVLDAELVQHADDRAAQVLAAPGVVGAAIAAISASSPRCCSPASSAANASRSSSSSSSRSGRPGPRRRTSRGTRRRMASASSRSPRAAQDAARARRRRRRGVGSSSSARRRSSSPPASTSASASDGQQRVEEAARRRRAAARR